MRPVTFSADDLRAIAHDRYHHPHPRVQRKLHVLWYKSHGLPHAQIATLAGVSRATVQRYLDAYLSGGLARVRQFRWQRSPSALEEHTFSLEAYFWKHPPRSTKHAQAVIAQQTGIRRGLTQVRVFLKYQLGLRWTKAGTIPCPPKKTPEEQARIQTAFLHEQLEPKLHEARQGQRTVFFVAAAHFRFAAYLGFLGSLTRLFVRGGHGRQRYNVLGALHAVTHELLGVANVGSSNAESVCTLLRAVAALGLPTPVTLVLDNARYQRCALVQDLAAALGSDLLFLPSYSPNLNLMERVWRCLRQAVLDTTQYDTFDQFTTSIDQGLTDLPTKYRAEMDTLLTHKFQLFTDVSVLAA